MHTSSRRKLLTCRYWAFGPRCPNVDTRNVQTCCYAHWDTGRLAGFYEQRGTCYEWFVKRFCPYGVSCSYEHRDTGVMGLNQGMLVLHGLNLEIADAANKSGFHTRNQVALMDLIWAVRRITFRHGVVDPAVQRPPKHCIYPDRYRPDNASNNANKSRKRGRESERQSSGNGTFDDPIEIDGSELGTDGVGTAANSSAKRLKVPVGQLGNYKVQLPTRPKILNPVHPAKFQNSSNKRQPLGRPAQRTTAYASPAQNLNLPPSQPRSTCPVFHSPPALAPKPRDRAMVQLQKVGNTLQDNIDAVVECGNVMRAMYYKDDRLADDTVYKELERLKENFDSCLSGAEIGIKIVGKIINLLEDNKENVTGSASMDL